MLLLLANSLQHVDKRTVDSQEIAMSVDGGVKIARRAWVKCHTSHTETDNWCIPVARLAAIVSPSCHVRPKKIDRTSILVIVTYDNLSFKEHPACVLCPLQRSAPDNKHPCTCPNDSGLNFAETEPVLRK